MGKVYDLVKAFKRKYPGTVAFRSKQHAKIVEINLNHGEHILYAFAAQKNDSWANIVSSCVVALSNERILIGQKRLLFGYFFYAITPDMFNDIKTRMCLVWGRVYIDTVKEFVALSNISKNALPEIQKAITSYMMEEKKKYH